MPKTSASDRATPSIDQSRLLKTIGYNLRRAYLLVSREFSGPMSQVGLRPAEFAVLALLLDNGGSSQRSLANALAIDPPNMATLLDRLEARDLVKRERNPADERAHQLKLTPGGRRLILRTYQAVDDLERKAVDVLSAAEQRQLMTLLRKLIASEVG